jgi:hypothetical protein
MSLAIVGCDLDPVAIQTQSRPAGICAGVPVRGMVVVDQTWGLALLAKDETGNPHKYGVVWPHGYSARRVQGIVYLLGSAGTVVAREGDTVVFEGVRYREPLQPCGDVLLDLD